MDMSRVEDILKYFLGEAETLPHPLSRVEELLIALGELISSGVVSSPIKIKGRVDTVADLPSNAEPGWMYYVGPANASEFAEYVYLDSGEWQYIGTSNSAIDTTLSTTSTNPVENRVITEAINHINQTLSNKVDKVTGKGLSTEDFTTEEKTKLSSIEMGANANVQVDWNQTDNTADDFIKNKPIIPESVVVDQTYNAFSANAQSGTAVAGALDDKVDKVAGKGLSTEDFTTAEKAKLYNIESGAQANVQVDWNQTDTSADDFIKNKPDITFVQVNADWNATSGVAQILNKPNIPEGVIVDLVYDPTSEHAQAGVAIAEAISNKVDKVNGKGLSTNDFTDNDKTKLDGVESGAQANVQADWNQNDSTADDFIKNKPTIPSGVVVDQVYDATSTNAQAGVAVAEAIADKVDKVNGKGLSTNDFTDNDKTKLDGVESGAQANVQADWNQTDSTADDYIKNKPTIPFAQVNADWDAVSGVAQILNKPTLATVATSGSYDDLSNKPTIPFAQVNADWDAVSGVAQILNKPSLATVATSGSYDDLSNKPTIPTVNDATLEIQKNGVKVGEFSADASSDVTVNITVPVNASDVNALPDTTKYASSIDVSINSSTYVMTTTLKDQDGNTLGTAQVVDLPLETMVVGGSYDDTNRKIILTLNNGTTVDFSVADLVSGLQSEITSTNKLDADLVDDSASTNKFVTAADKTAWNAKSDFSGSYNDLTNKPAIPTVDQTYDDTSTNPQSGTAVAQAIAKKPGEITTGKQYTIDGQTVTAGTGAEVFNNVTNNKASGDNSHAEGTGTTASGNNSHAEGSGTIASGSSSHAEGVSTKASSSDSHAEGGSTTASGSNSHAEGAVTRASGSSSHAEGGGTTASGDNSHAEGGSTTASGSSSHAEGQSTTAYGNNSHAEGAGTTASGAQSHAEGGGTTASGAQSHAEGSGTKSSSANQHVQGKFNVEDANDTYAFIIGNGTANNARHNAFAVDWNGLIYVNGAATGVDVSQLTPVTVDQTYNAQSANAQSGVAVAQAVQDSGSEYSARVMNLEAAYGDPDYLEGLGYWGLVYHTKEYVESGSALSTLRNVTITPGTTILLKWDSADGRGYKDLTYMFSRIGMARYAPDYPVASAGWSVRIVRYETDSQYANPEPLPDDFDAVIYTSSIAYGSSESYSHSIIKAPPMKPGKYYYYAIEFLNDNESASFTCSFNQKVIAYFLQEPSNQPIMYDGVTRQQFIMPKGIKSTDYATQTTGGTVKAWTTTDGSDTILHLATQ